MNLELSLLVMAANKVSRTLFAPSLTGDAAGQPWGWGRAQKFQYHRNETPPLLGSVDQPPSLSRSPWLLALCLYGYDLRRTRSAPDSCTPMPPLPLYHDAPPPPLPLLLPPEKPPLTFRSSLVLGWSAICEPLGTGSARHPMSHLFTSFARCGADDAHCAGRIPASCGKCDRDWNAPAGVTSEPSGGLRGTEHLPLASVHTWTAIRFVCPRRLPPS